MGAGNLRANLALARRVLVSLLLLGAAPAAYPDPFLQDNLKWLGTVASAAHSVEYSGTYVYQYGSHVETSRITHVVDVNGEHGRLESLDGARREVIHSNGESWCYVGDNRVKVEAAPYDNGFPALLPGTQSLEAINKNYQIRQDGEGRVAGLHAHAILFQPRDSSRYSHRLWADSASGLLLKAEVLDEHGVVVEQYAFTQLAIGGNIDRTWMIKLGKEAANVKPGMAAPARQHASPRKAAAAPAPVGWQVDAMPEGFVKVAEISRPMHNHTGHAIQIVYSDGLSSVSIFIEENDNDEDDQPGLTSQGATQIYSKFQEDHLVTVVGEVPPKTVIQVANSVRRSGD